MSRLEYAIALVSLVLTLTFFVIFIVLHAVRTEPLQVPTTISELREGSS